MLLFQLQSGIYLLNNSNLIIFFLFKARNECYMPLKSFSRTCNLMQYDVLRIVHLITANISRVAMLSNE
jgi:hypothetical protein